jgi:hypothetical protein
VISSEVLKTMTLQQIKGRGEVENRVERSCDEVENSKADSMFKDIKSVPNAFGMDTMIDQIIVKANSVELSHLTIALIVPNIMGSAEESFFKIAEQFKFPTFLLQLFKTAECTEFNEIIELIKNDVMQLFSDDKFILIGQSFRASVALKLAAILEDHGKTGNVVSIDCSPK